jgi:hypothetical protein
VEDGIRIGLDGSGAFEEEGWRQMVNMRRRLRLGLRK